MAEDAAPQARYGEAFWRAHHEAWKRSDLNQREYCEAEGLSLKAFGNWRAKFKAEPQPPARKLLWRRGGASHSLGHTPSHSLSHVTYPSFAPSPGPIVPPARVGHRRRFSEADRRHILSEADKPGTSVSEVARRYGIARRVLCRWRQTEFCFSVFGLLGYTVDVDPEAGELTASFDGRSITYRFGELDTLVPAYAVTIRKSQGSEYPALVIPVMTQYYTMLQRNLLYTGVTRGQAPGRAGRTEEGCCYRGAQRVRPAPLVEAERMAQHQIGPN